MKYLLRVQAVSTNEVRSFGYTASEPTKQEAVHRNTVIEFETLGDLMAFYKKVELMPTKEGDKDA